MPKEDTPHTLLVLNTLPRPEDSSFRNSNLRELPEPEGGGGAGRGPAVTSKGLFSEKPDVRTKGTSDRDDSTSQSCTGPVVALAAVVSAANTSVRGTVPKGFMHLSSFNLGSKRTCFA